MSNASSTSTPEPSPLFAHGKSARATSEPTSAKAENTTDSSSHGRTDAHSLPKTSLADSPGSSREINEQARVRQLADDSEPLAEPRVSDAARIDHIRGAQTPNGLPLPSVKFHALRHLQASLMLAAGVSLPLVSKRLGHSSVQITSDTYSHLLEGVGAAAASAAAALIPRRSAEVP